MPNKPAIPLYHDKVNRWVLLIDGTNVKSASDLEQMVIVAFQNWFSASRMADIFSLESKAGLARNIKVWESSTNRLSWDSPVTANRSTSEGPLITLMHESSPIYAKVTFDWRGPDASLPADSWPRWSSPFDIKSTNRNDVVLETISQPKEDSPPLVSGDPLSDIVTKIQSALLMPVVLVSVGALAAVYLLGNARK